MFALVTIVFLLPRALPGDPLGALIDPEAGQTFTADARAQLEAHYGLDQPLGEQYVRYLGRIATLDFGWSISQQTPVTDLVKARLPWTLLLMGTAVTLAATISWTVGVRAAWHRGTRRDRTAVAVLTTLRAIPEFAIAAVLLVVFAVVLPWFPVAGSRTVFAQHSSWFTALLDILHHLVLPVTALTLSLIGTKFLLVRNTMIGCLGQDYMVMARAKGLPEAIQRRRHAGRNAIAPFLALVGIQVGFAVGGTIFVEQVFSYPGMGTLVLSAVDFRDYPLLEALFLILAATVLAANLVVDLVTTWITPASTG
jgi:peptide/nickel transport system permease protein